MLVPVRPEVLLKKLMSQEPAGTTPATEAPATTEDTIGVRDLKNNLSRELKRVQAGVRLTVTDRGQPVAVLGPLIPRPEDEWAYRMVAEGSAYWDGGKPKIPRRTIKLKGEGPSMADIVLENR